MIPTPIKSTLKDEKIPSALIGSPWNRDAARRRVPVKSQGKGTSYLCGQAEWRSHRETHGAAVNFVRLVLVYVGISRESWSIRASDDCLLLRSDSWKFPWKKSPIPNLNSVRVGYARRRDFILERFFSLLMKSCDCVIIIILRCFIISSISIAPVVVKTF